MDESKVNRLLELYCNDETFEDLLERLDITAEEVILLCFGAGLIDEDTVDELIGERNDGSWDDDT